MAKTYQTYKKLKAYTAWANMKSRCLNVKNPDFHNYGGRGIKIDPLWYSYKNFIKDMGKLYKKGLTLDRIDNNGNYTKKNCRWVSRKVQNNNRRDNKIIAYKGLTKTLTQWAEYLGIRVGTLNQRFYTYKWTINKCFEYKHKGGIQIG